MDNLCALSEQLDSFQRKMQKIKKENIQSEDFLHSGELSLMKFIAHHYMKFEKAPTLVTISHVIGISGATATTLADRLIKKGLLKKEVSPTDKRAKLISLTDKGYDYLRANQHRNREILMKVISSLGEDDICELVRILKRINENF